MFWPLTAREGTMALQHFEGQCEYGVYQSACVDGMKRRSVARKCMRAAAVVPAVLVPTETELWS